MIIIRMNREDALAEIDRALDPSPTRGELMPTVSMSPARDLHDLQREIEERTAFGILPLDRYPDDDYFNDDDDRDPYDLDLVDFDDF